MKIPLVDLKAQFSKIREEIESKISEVLACCQFVQGASVKLFEEEFANFCGENLHCASCGNGTDALYLALRALGVQNGDEVILPVNTFIGTAEAVSLNGAKPVFVDIDPRTYNIDVDAVQKAITPKTKAVIAVHLYGQPCQMDQLQALCAANSLFLVEDAAQAHGAAWKGVRVGGLGDVACFSFFPGKNLGCYGDGGAIVSRNLNLISQARCLANHGRLEKYLHQCEGVNSRLDTIQAEVLRVKLRYLEAWTNLRNQIAQFYKEQLKGTVDLPYVHPDAFSAWHLFVIRVKNRNYLLEKLQEEGIYAGVHYPIPLHLQPAYSHLNHSKGDFAQAESAANEILSLPLFPELTDEQQSFVVRTLIKLQNTVNKDSAQFSLR